MVGSAIIELPGNLTVANIHPIHEQFEALVDDKANDHITIRADGVSRADTAGIQLLHAFVIAAHDRKISVDWDSPSEKLCSAAEILGMKGLLGIQ